MKPNPKAKPKFTTFRRHDNFTVAVQVLTDGTVKVGVTRKNPTDEYNQHEAHKIAIKRALVWPELTGLIRTK